MGLLDNKEFIGAKFFLSRWKGHDPLALIEDFALRLIKNPYFDSHCCLLSVPLPFLAPLAKKLVDPRIILGADTMQSAAKDTFTASISAPLLEKHQARFVLIGSSGSRSMHSADSLNYKEQIKAALASGITPLFCIGETFKQQQAGQAHTVLLEQCKEAISGLTQEELSKLCIVYEAPWFKEAPGKPSLEELTKRYRTFKQAVQESVDPEIFSRLKLIDGLPLELEETDRLLEVIQDKGLYAATPEIFFSFLNEKCADKLKVEETVSAPLFLEGKVPPKRVFKEEEKNSIRYETKDSFIETSSEQVDTTIDEPTYAIAAQEEKADLIETLENAKKLEPLLKEATLQEQEKQEEKLGLELLEEQKASTPPPASAPRIHLADPEDSASREEESTPASTAIVEEEILRAAESAENYPMSILAEAPSETTSLPSELQELQMKLQHLNSLDKSLAECYRQIQEKMESLPSLRQIFPELLNQMTVDLNKLDPLLQGQINRGNIAYFMENPDKMKEASGVLMQIQEINQLLQKTAAIPREVDRILSKSREIRKALEAEWSYFRISRQRIKESYPDFPYPSAPSQLMIQEPKTAITPMDFGPSCLINKRFAVVKAPPLPR